MLTSQTQAVKVKAKSIPGLAPAGVAKRDDKTKPVEKARKPATVFDCSTASVGEQLGGMALTDETAVASTPITKNDVVAPPDPAKRLKALKKKLREIDELSKKVTSDLTSEQVQKIAKKSAIEEEVQQLSSSS